MTTVYGISNCDTVRKARKWLSAHDIEHVFHDVRSDGISAKLIRSWLSSVSLSTLTNKRSTSWKQLDDMQRNDLTSACEDDVSADQIDNALALLAAMPTLIKRPVLVANRVVQVGFAEKAYGKLMQDGKI